MNLLISHQYIIELIGTLLLNGIDMPVSGQAAELLSKFDRRMDTEHYCKCFLHFLHKIAPCNVQNSDTADKSLLHASSTLPRLGNLAP